MHHINGIDRDQITMFPEALDDYISEDNPVRLIDGFRDCLPSRISGMTWRTIVIGALLVRN